MSLSERNNPNIRRLHKQFTRNRLFAINQNHLTHQLNTSSLAHISILNQGQVIVFFNRSSVHHLPRHSHFCLLIEHNRCSPLYPPPSAVCQVQQVHHVHRHLPQNHTGSGRSHLRGTTKSPPFWRFLTYGFRYHLTISIS